MMAEFHLVASVVLIISVISNTCACPYMTSMKCLLREAYISVTADLISGDPRSAI